MNLGLWIIHFLWFYGIYFDAGKLGIRVTDPWPFFERPQVRLMNK
jgi:hypothetical protein